MIIASEHRRTKAGSRAEMLWGDGAAALTVGDDEVIAQCLAVATNAVTLWIITGEKDRISTTTGKSAGFVMRAS